MLRRLLQPSLALVLASGAVVATPVAAGAGGRGADQDIATESVLTADDVPTGFAQAPAGSDETPSRGPKCKALTKAAKALNAAPNEEVAFRNSAKALINNQVSVFETPKAAKAAYAGYATKSTETCLEQGFEESYREQLDDPNAEVEVNVLRYEPDLGDASVGYDLEIGIAAGGDTGVLYGTLEVAQLGRAVSGYAFLQENELFASDTIVAVTAAGMARLEQAL